LQNNEIMDSVTHIVLGAVIGEAVAGRRLGKKALVIGAVVNMLPDIDFLASFWLGTARDVWFHRGITHSILFVTLAAVLLGAIARRVYRAAGMGLWEWSGFLGAELFSHIFIDSFNSYGTGWFEPFNHYRVSFNVIFVADPLYSVWLGLAALVLVVLRRGHAWRRRWAWMGLILSSGYLCYCLYNKWSVDRSVERQLAAEGVRYSDYFTTPTPFNSWLWYVVAEASGPGASGSGASGPGANDPAPGRRSVGYYTGYRSVFDSPERPLELRWQPRNDEGLAAYRKRNDLRYLLRFAQGDYSVGSFEGRTVFSVIRFGEVQGWRDSSAPFVFHYFLADPADNRFVIQRGRWRGWDEGAWKAFIRRIEGD
jgi:inner membrane protein